LYDNVQGMIKQLQVAQIKKSLFAVPRWMGENAFFGFLILFFIALLISSLVFYRYVFTARNTELQADITEARFQEQILQNILQTWGERERKSTEAGILPIRNIFILSESDLENTEEE